MTNEPDDPKDDDGLGDYERAFMDGWLFSRGIAVPNHEQFIEALTELERFLELQQSNEPKPN
jgi:hypothetical protein